MTALAIALPICVLGWKLLHIWQETRTVRSEEIDELRGLLASLRGEVEGHAVNRLGWQEAADEQLQRLEMRISAG